ncbi:MAG: hypothetical protein ACREP3_08205 [Candidatus Binatia bacterium]
MDTSKMALQTFFAIVIGIPPFEFCRTYPWRRPRFVGAAIAMPLGTQWILSANQRNEKIERSENVAS